MTEEVVHSKDGGRVPPQDIQAEKSLLGAIMISGTYAIYNSTNQKQKRFLTLIKQEK